MKRMLLKRYLDHDVSKPNLSRRSSVTSDAIVGEDRQSFGPWRVGYDGEEGGRGQGAERIAIADNAGKRLRTASTRLVPLPRSTCGAWR